MEVTKVVLFTMKLRERIVDAYNTRFNCESEEDRKKYLEALGSCSVRSTGHSKTSSISWRMTKTMENKKVLEVLKEICIGTNCVEYAEATGVAISNTIKQIPMKLVGKHAIGDTCPICGAYVSLAEDVFYCSHCGQRVKEEEDDRT